jgi:hypothetical protein
MASGDGNPGGEGDGDGDEKSGPEPGDGLGAARFEAAAGEKCFKKKQCRYCRMKSEPPRPGNTR